MFRPALALLLTAAVLTGCGDDEPVRAESTIAGSTVIKKIEAAMQKAGSGKARTHDGDTEYAWNFAGVDRLLVVFHGKRLESRQIGDTVYQRRRGNPLWVSFKVREAIEPIPELSFFKGREATEVTVDGVPVQYVVQVPSRLVIGKNEDPGGGDELAVTIFVDDFGLPTRTQVEGNGLAGERFSDWGAKILIEKPDNVYKGPKKG
ncbi:MAG TPA: hypothetical protein VFK41_13205 [Nocardioidaceae bacterium]|nr:hypothetical protein [Nocardioidaceae bacterium]